MMRLCACVRMCVYKRKLIAIHVLSETVCNNKNNNSGIGRSKYWCYCFCDDGIHNGYTKLHDAKEKKRKEWKKWVQNPFYSSYFASIVNWNSVSVNGLLLSLSLLDLGEPMVCKRQKAALVERTIPFHSWCSTVFQAKYFAYPSEWEEKRGKRCVLYIHIKMG